VKPRFAVMVNVAAILILISNLLLATEASAQLAPPRMLEEEASLIGLPVYNLEGDKFGEVRDVGRMGSTEAVEIESRSTALMASTVVRKVKAWGPSTGVRVRGAHALVPLGGAVDRAQQDAGIRHQPQREH
jgi:hypothetical protein